MDRTIVKPRTLGEAVFSDDLSSTLEWVANISERYPGVARPILAIYRPRLYPSQKTETIKLCISIHFGTSETAAACMIKSMVGEEEVPLISYPVPLLLDGQSYTTPATISWSEGKLICGRRSADKTETHDALSDGIIECFAPLIHDCPETSEIPERVKGILSESGKSLDDITADYLGAIFNGALKAVLDTEYRKLFEEHGGPYSIMDLPCSVQVALPQKWGPEARRRVQAALTNANLPGAELVHETQCILAYLVDTARRTSRFDGRHERTLRRVCRNATVLVMDLGCRSGEMALYRLEDDVSPKSTLEDLGHSSGDQCGSCQVDELLLEKAEQHGAFTGWRETTTARLGIQNKDEFEKRALAAMENMKMFFNADEDRDSLGTVWGEDDIRKTSSLEKKYMHEAFDTVIANICKQADKLISSAGGKLGAVYVTGGFSKSEYLMNELRQHYEKDGDTVVLRVEEPIASHQLAVAIGGCL